MANIESCCQTVTMTSCVGIWSCFGFQAHDLRVLRMIEVAIDATAKEQLLIEELEEFENSPEARGDRLVI